MNEKYERQMKKGVLDMLVLKLLEEEDKYGYQLIQQLQERGGDALSGFVPVGGRRAGGEPMERTGRQTGSA